jgi:cytochrome c oxidase subunit 2
MVVLMRDTLGASVGTEVLTTLAALVAGAGFLVAAASALDGAGSQEPRARQVVEIAAERFSFTPSEVRMKSGTALEIRLRSDDTAHGFHILGTDIDIELPKRGRGAATVTFQPSGSGRYTFECSQLCGAGHAFMRGVIVVE